MGAPVHSIDMQHLFQCLATIQQGLLVAACGPCLVVYRLHDQTILSEWSSLQSETHTVETGEPDDVNTRRAAKRQKSIASANAPNVIKLAIAKDETHVVAVTDDKAIRVLQWIDGHLKELSRRVMPKKPCAVQILPDDSTILCADKFGDVYSLPLLHASQVSDMTASGPQHSLPLSEGRFKPSASTLTVHSKRNLQALEAQMNQKHFTPRKDSLNFDYKLLLGHVSMLTDMKYIQDLGDSKKAFIFTADRDEHIRVSRAPPQSCVIEGFCLGHTSFISKIAQLGRTELLISGGGDSWLGVWKWPTFQLCNRLDLLNHVRRLDGHENDDQLALSGLWSMGIDQRTLEEPVLLASCEKVEALFLLSRSALLANSVDDGDQSLVQTVCLPGYPLDVTILDGKVVVSLDVRSGQEPEHRVHAFLLKEVGRPDVSNFPSEIGKAQFSGLNTDKLLTLNEYNCPQHANDKELDDLLYGVANLRKRAHQDEEGQDDADGD